MKKNILLILVGLCPMFSLSGQQVTKYGTGTSSAGWGHSFFGYNSGQSSQDGSVSNSFFGHSSGRNTTVGSFNTAMGVNAMLYNTTGQFNTAVGMGSLKSNLTAYANVAVGYNSLSHNTTGDANTAAGCNALLYNTIGKNNVALGNEALFLNTNGEFNTAAGSSALHENTTGSRNTASGYKTLYLNETGFNNAAMGYQALYSNQNGNYNCAVGVEALYANTTGDNNTAHGYRTLFANTTGYYNTALGNEAIYSNIDGKFNFAAGYYALHQNVSGNHNSGSGFRALNNNTTGGNNAAHGSFALYNITTGSYNSALGFNAGPTIKDLTNTTAIGYQAVPTASNQVRIGNGSVASIGGQVSWSTFSDGRFKKDIKEDVSGLDFINELRPVSYVIDKQEVDKFLHIPDSLSRSMESKNKLTRQTGFVAQEVEAVLKKTGYVFYGVDAPDNENDHYSIRYAEFVVPLVKAVQELTAEVRSQRQKISDQEQKIAFLTDQLKGKNVDGSLTHASSHAVLLQNNPNPFTADTEIKMTLSDQIQYARVIIYNPEGKQMKTIQINDRGDVTIKIAGSEFSVGMYFYTLIADGNVVDTKRMILTH